MLGFLFSGVFATALSAFAFARDLQNVDVSRETRFGSLVKDSRGHSISRVHCPPQAHLIRPPHAILPMAKDLLNTEWLSKQK